MQAKANANTVSTQRGQPSVIDFDSPEQMEVLLASIAQAEQAMKDGAPTISIAEARQRLDAKFQDYVQSQTA